MTYKNFAFRNVQVNVEQSFFYACCDADYSSIVLEDVNGVSKQEFPMNYTEAVYAYNIKTLLKGRIEPYQVSRQALGG